MTQRLLYIFNPEHDLALASGESNYMPPASARQMKADLALLPLWYADKKSLVLAPSAYNLDFIQKMKALLPLSTNLMTEPELAVEKKVKFSPWGWDTALKEYLLALGVEAERLPSQEYIMELRRYSHRRMAVEMLPSLQLNEYFCGVSCYMEHPGEWQQFVERRSESLLKAPLSGSGKGLQWCKREFTPFISGWCKRIGASQGGVIGEPVYKKTEDFAMEFYSDGAGEVTFAGYSMFCTGKKGVYESSWLLSDEEIERQLMIYLPQVAFKDLRFALELELSKRFGNFYQGYLGVDMMVCQFEYFPYYRIHPCVEVNLRMNMGVVARKITDKYLVPGMAGMFRIAYASSPGAALAQHQELTEKYPLKIKKGKIYSGYLSLVPVTSQSCYRAWILVHH